LPLRTDYSTLLHVFAPLINRRGVNDLFRFPEAEQINHNYSLYTINYSLSSYEEKEI
jgi:hypothetical protein